MSFTPKDIISFGKHRGFTFADIYRFCPDYLEWAIEYIPDFVLKIEAFESLPKPTPYKYEPTVLMGGREMRAFNCNSSDIPYAKAALENGERLCDIDYHFPERIKSINSTKMSGTYSPPGWVPLDQRPRENVSDIKIEEIDSNDVVERLRRFKG